MTNYMQVELLLTFLIFVTIARSVKCLVFVKILRHACCHRYRQALGGTKITEPTPTRSVTVYSRSREQ